MRIAFKTFSHDEPIPVLPLLSNKKMSKYYNRETSAGIVCFSEMASGLEIPENTPFYYATCVTEFEDYGLDKIVEATKSDDGRFSQERFVERGMSSISPLTQFKILYNMPLSFISIDKHLTGDNAVIYDSARGLIDCARNAPVEDLIIIGAGRVRRDGTVESGFAALSKLEIDALPEYEDEIQAVEIFRNLYAERSRH